MILWSAWHDNIILVSIAPEPLCNELRLELAFVLMQFSTFTICVRSEQNILKKNVPADNYIMDVFFPAIK